MERADEIEMAPALISNKYNSNKQDNKLETSNAIRTNGNRKESKNLSWEPELVKSSPNADDIGMMHDLKKEIETKKIGNIKDIEENHRLMLIFNEMEKPNKVKENNSYNKCNGDGPDTETKVNGGIGDITHDKMDENQSLIAERKPSAQDVFDSMDLSIPTSTASLDKFDNIIGIENTILMDTLPTMGSSGVPLSHLASSCLLSGSSHTLSSGSTNSDDLRNQLCSLLGSNAPLVTDKLTNTLQELAMAVKGSSMNNNQQNVNQLNLFSSITETEKQNCETVEVKRQKQQQQKFEMASEMEDVVSKKLLAVRDRLLVSRCLAVNSLAKEQLKKISNFHFSKLSLKKNGKYDKKSKYTNNSLLSSFSTMTKKLPENDLKINGKVPVPKQAILPFNDMGRSKKFDIETTQIQKSTTNELLQNQEIASQNTKYFKDLVRFSRMSTDSYVTDSSSDEESSTASLKNSGPKEPSNQIESLASITNRWRNQNKKISRKWTWLKTQIADLETQIQRVAELQNITVVKKKCVFVQDVPSPGQQNNPNGYYSAARTLPVDSTMRRKIVNISSDQSLLNKTVRSYPCKCEMCGEPLHKVSNGVKSCAYNGRFHKAYCTLPNHNSNHCYLSQPKDVALSSRLSSIMASKTNWHTLVRPTMLKETQKSQKLLNQSNTKQDYVPRKRKYRSSNKKSRTLSSSSLQEDSNQELFQRPTYSSLDLDGDSRLGTPVASRSASRAATPNSELSQHRKKRPIDQSSSYDINNIIIPHGVTIAARIEILHYKEILTPSWRVIPEIEETKINVEKDLPQPVPNLEPPTKAEEFEDISEESYKTKHDRYEILEKRKFLAYLSWTDSKKAHTSRTSISAAVDEYLQNKSAGLLPSNTFSTPTSPELATPKSRSRRTSSDSQVGSKEPHTTITGDSVLQVQHDRNEPPSKPALVLQAYKRRPSTEDCDVYWEKRTFPLDGIELEHLDTDIHVNYVQRNNNSKDLELLKDAGAMIGQKRRYSKFSHSVVDEAEHSDGSVVSNTSKKRRRKLTLSRANSDSNTKINQAYDRVSITLERLADTLHQRNSSHGWDSSDTETASSVSDDAGNIINDFDDPEWKFLE